jgi:hypothetical protein
MGLTDAVRTWQVDGFVILPGFIPAHALRAAVGELGRLFPSAEGFHDGTDPRAERFIGDEFAGIDILPISRRCLVRVGVRDRVFRPHRMRLPGREAA